MERIEREGRTAAIVAYLTIVGTIIAFFMNNDSKNSFAGVHIRQALGIHVTFYLLGLIVPWFNNWYATGAFYIFILTLWGYGIAGAIQGKKNIIPFMGNNFQKWFSTIQ